MQYFRHCHADYAAAVEIASHAAIFAADDAAIIELLTPLRHATPASRLAPCPLK